MAHNIRSNQNNQNMQNDKSLSQLMKIRSLIEDNNLQELAEFIAQEKVSESCLNHSINLVAEIYNKDNPYIINMFNIFLESGADVNTRIQHSTNFQIKERDQVTLLMFAVMVKNVDLVHLVLKYNPDINLTDAKERTAIFYAILFPTNPDDPTILSLLLHAGANITSTIKLEMPSGYFEIHSVFTLACSSGLKNTVKFLLDNYANVGFKVSPTGDTGLHIAVKNGNVELVKILLGYKNILPNIHNKENMRPMDIAKMKGGEIYKIFVDFYNRMYQQQNQMQGQMQNPMQNQMQNQMHGQMQVQLQKPINEGQEIQSNQSSDAGVFVEEDKVKFNEKNIEQIKKKLSSCLARKVKFNSNLEIPVEFEAGGAAKSTLGSFVKISSPPILSLDLNDKTFELELELNEIKGELNKKMQILSQYQSTIQDLDNKTKELTEELQKKDKTIDYLKALEIENTQKIEELNKEKDELIAKFPKDKFSKESKKNLPVKEYIESKFHQAYIDENYITKTLEKDLRDYDVYIKDVVGKIKVNVDKLVNNVQMTVNEISKDFKVEVYGSYATGLSLPWSGLDLVLVYTKVPSNPDVYFLNKLGFLLKKKPWASNIKVIENAIVPSVKIITTNQFSNIHVDISIQDKNHFGLRRVSLINSYLKAYVVLEPMILALKTILKNSNLNNTYTGGLSSYGLILMVVSFIQNKIESGEYDEKESEDLIGKTFYGFLGHYGVYFDFSKYVILTYQINGAGEEEENSNLEFGQNAHELIIVDPLNQKNNVARYTHQFMNLKMAFMIAYMVTKEDCECGCHYGKGEYEHTLDSTEHCMLKRMFNSVKRFSDSANK